ncbi:MAG: GlxA family transcriptional regulator [Acidimicrobiia bacterium]
MRCGVVLVDGCFGSAVASLVDVLRTADAFRDQIDPAIPPIEITTISTGTTATTSAGWAIPIDDGLDAIAGLDTVIVPALGALTAEQVVTALQTVQVKETIEAIKASEASLVGGACTGTFPLAEAGLLDGREATTSWWLGAEFRKRYRSVTLHMDRMVVADGPVITAGAAFAHVDLSLALVASLSPELATLVAQLLVVDERPDQGSYIALEVVSRADPLVREFERHVRAHLSDDITIEGIADELGTSVRTLERRLADTVGISPMSFVQRVRVERALHLRSTTDLSLDRIATEVGYRNTSTLRALLRRHRGTSRI